MGKFLHYLGVKNHFLNRTQKALTLKETSAKLNLIKIKNSCSPKDTIKRIKNKSEDERRTSAIYICE